MTSVELLADLVASLAEGIHKAVTGLSVPELTWQPDAEGNSIGVTVWHCSRGLDVLKVRFLEQQPAQAEQWHTQVWAEKTGYDPRGIGLSSVEFLLGRFLKRSIRQWSFAMGVKTFRPGFGHD